VSSTQTTAQKSLDFSALFCLKLGANKKHQAMVVGNGPTTGEKNGDALGCSQLVQT
jgi:hypothetical protein